MKTSFKKPLMLLSLATALVGCKEGSDSSSANDTSALSLASQTSGSGSGNSGPSGCTVTQVAAGAQITCGNTTALVANGTDGTSGAGATGATGAAGPIGPTGLQGVPGTSAGATSRLINGDGNQVGDAVVGVSGADTSLPMEVTVYDAATDATILYRAGVANDPNFGDGVSFPTTDCTGQAQHFLRGGGAPTNGLPADYLLAVGSRFYKVTGEIIYSQAKSSFDHSGNCIVNSNPPITYFYTKSVLVSTSLPRILKDGYAIKLR